MMQNILQDKKCNKNYTISETLSCYQLIFELLEASTVSKRDDLCLINWCVFYFIHFAPDSVLNFWPYIQARKKIPLQHESVLDYLQGKHQKDSSLMHWEYPPINTVSTSCRQRYKSQCGWLSASVLLKSFIQALLCLKDCTWLSQSLFRYLFHESEYRHDIIESPTLFFKTS